MIDPFTVLASVRTELAIPDNFTLLFSKTTCFVSNESGVIVCQGDTLAELEANWWAMLADR